MRHENRIIKIGCCLFSAVLLVAMTASVPAQENHKAKKFLTKPLVIEDQGSFFIGGVPKVTRYATTQPPYRSMSGVDTGWARRLGALFRAPRDFHLRCRSIRTRALRVRRVRHP